jgi:sec-independent protein translocase protein TatC
MSKELTNNQAKEEKEMPFFDHLEELRWHLVRSSLALAFFAIIVFIFKDFIFSHIIFGIQNNSFPTYKLFCMISEVTCMQPADLEIVPVQLGERFFTHLRVSFWLGFIMSFPYLFYEFWRFISPGLYDNERKAAKGIVFSCSVLFLSGVLFGYFIIAPFGFKFLGGYSLSSTDLVSQTTSLSSFVGYLTNFTIPTGLVFQLPVVVYFLAKIGLVTPDIMKNYRRHAIVVILLFSAIITPPDMVTQILIGIPILLLYEASIHICNKAYKSYAKDM